MGATLEALLDLFAPRPPPPLSIVVAAAAVPAAAPAVPAANEAASGDMLLRERGETDSNLGRSSAARGLLPFVVFRA